MQKHNFFALSNINALDKFAQKSPIYIFLKIGNIYFIIKKGAKSYYYL